MKLNFILTWFARCSIIDALIDNQEPTFSTTDTKLYLSVVTLSTQDYEKLLEQLKSGFKGRINEINIIQNWQYSSETDI